jgi:hypothetical protein
MKALLVQLLAGIMLSSLLGGCAGTRPRSDVQEYLEEATGSSVTYVTTPAAFVLGQPGLAESGRDYVYLAPIVVSSGGDRSYWLWLGVWSTVDRQARHEDASPLRLGALQIVADDEPMDLEPQSADSNPAGIRRIPYATPVPPIQEFLVPVTRSQIQRLGNARVLTLTDRPADGASRLWRGNEQAAAIFSHFADEAGAARSATSQVTGR